MVEFQQISEREILVGKTRIFLSNDGILYHVASGDMDEEIATMCCEQTLKLLQDQGKQNAHYMIDLNNGGKTTRGARTTLKKFTENEVHGKLALCGAHPVARVLASFFTLITKRDNMRFFKTEKDALEWLRES